MDANSTDESESYLEKSKITYRIEEKRVHSLSEQYPTPIALHCLNR